MSADSIPTGRLFFLCGIFLLGYQLCVAQQKVEIRGRVTDEEGAPLKFSSIELRLDTSATIIGFAITKEDGTYRISVPSKYTILSVSASMVGYTSVRKTIRVKDSTKVDFILGHIKLQLREVTVKSQQPKVRVSGDTTTFKADKYRDSTEKVAEDLFRKIPGIEIDNNGAITYNGKSIDKILVEGDDLFNRHYTILSRNLSADLIDQVQVIDKYQENPLLKKVAPSSSRILNITLKKERKKIFFGKVDIAAGNDGRYESDINAISFTTHSKVFLFTDWNSIGKVPLTDLGENSALGEQSKNDVDETAMEAGFIAGDKLYSLDIPEQRYNFNAAKLNALSFITKPSTHFSVQGLFYFYTDINRQYQSSLTAYNLNNTVFDLTENSAFRALPRLNSGNVSLIWDITAQQRLQFNVLEDHRTADQTTGVLTNGSAISQALADRTGTLTQKVDYTLKLGDSTAFHLKGIYSHYSGEQHLDLHATPPLAMLIGTDDSLLQQIRDEAGRWYIMPEFLGAHNRSLWSLTGTVGNRYFGLHTELDSMISGQKRALPDTFSNQLNAHRLNLMIKARYTYLESDQFRLIATLESDNAETSPSVAGESFSTHRDVFVCPSAAVQYHSADHFAALSYGYNYSLPSLANLSPSFIQTDYRSYQRFYSSIDPTRMQGIFGNYSYTNWGSGTVASANFMAMRQIKYYTGSVNIDSNYSVISNAMQQQTETMASLSLSVSQYLPFISSGIKVLTSLSRRSYDDLVNDVRRSVSSEYNSCEVSFRSAFNGIFNYHAGVVFEWDQSVARDTSTSRVANQRLSAFSDLTFKFSSKLWIKTSLDYYHFYQDQGSNNYCFLDLDVNNDIIPNKLSLELVGRNLLNASRMTNITVSDFSTQTVSSALLPCYAMVEVVYRF